MPQTYFLIPTADGEAKLANAQALGVALKLTAMSVGDGNGALPVPDRARKTLINERRRAAINSLSQDPQNASQFIAEQVIPETEGGWWIREAGLHAEDGTLVYYANIPETYKPVLAEGSARTQVVRLVCLNTSGATVELKVDPSIVLATRGYVDTQIAAELDKRDAKQSVLAATVGPLVALSGLQTVDSVVLTAGARVLVKDQALGKDNGIYLAAAGAWTRATDFDSGLDVTPGATVPVEQGTINADSIWQLSTDGAIIIGATPLAFKRAGDGYFAPLASPDFTGIPKVDTAPPGTSSRQAASTQFVANAIAALVAAAPGQLDTLNELAAALGNDANYAATVTAALAQKAALAGAAFTGPVTMPSAPQFDNDTSAATTEWVVKSGMRRSGLTVSTASATVDLSAFGGTILNGMATTNTQTLPALSTVPDGATIEFVNTGQAGILVQKAAADGTTSIAVNGGARIASIAVLPGEYLEIRKCGGAAGGYWVATGSAQLKYGSNYAFSASTSGYQKLHSGLIFQWLRGTFQANGVVQLDLGWPIAFPTTPLNVTVGGWENSFNNESPVQWNSNATTANVVRVTCSNAVAGATGFTVLALGN